MGSSLADDAGITLRPSQAMLGEFAAIVGQLADEMLEPLSRVLSWRVELAHGGVTLAVAYELRGVSEPQVGTVHWTPLGILNDGARVAVRQVQVVREAIDRAGSLRDG